MDTSILSIPTITSYHQQGDKAISAATNEINQLACQLMEKLDGRATALANGAQFELALRDAAFIRTLAPRLSLGYLTAGYIYRQQGYQQEAVAMYDQGLVHVPASDVCYTNLQLERADAANAASKRIDFITQLPLELVTAEILPLMFDNTPLQPDIPGPYLYVSHAWQHVILQSNNLDFYIDRHKCTLPCHDDQLARFSAHVTSLTIDECELYEDEDDDDDEDEHEDEGEGEDRRYTLLPILEYYQFQCLTHLCIRYNIDEEQDVMLIIQSLGHSLSHLELFNWDILEIGVALSFVLDHCPNLISLVLRNSEIHPLSSNYAKLQHLNIGSHLHSHPLSESTIANILSHMPSLLCCKVTPLPENTQCISSIQNYCPDMKHLSLGNWLDLEGGFQHGHGLQKLSFGNRTWEGTYDADATIQLLLDNHQSINELFFMGRVTYTPLDHPTATTFDRLKDFHLYASNDALVQLGKSFIHRFTHLCNLYIDLHTDNDHDIFDVMKGLSCLQRIHAEDIQPESQSFHNLLRHHIQLGTLSSLKELVIYFTADMWASPWFCAIAALPNLQRLETITHFAQMPSSYLTMMEVLATGCTSLTYLELHCSDHIMPEGAIAKWKNHPTIQRLRVQAESISDSDILSVISIPNLKHFIFKAPVQKHIVHVLQQSIEQVEDQCV